MISGEVEKTDHDPLAFIYSGAPQRSPEWLAIKRGRIGASRLGDWLAVSKAKTGAGKPLKPRLDYEKELMFERQFGVSFEVYVNSAMQEGIDYEDFARQQFIKAKPEFVATEVGCWYNDYIAVSPDRLIHKTGTHVSDIAPQESAEGVLEIKIVKDNTFTDILMDGVPDKHYKQIQGQLWATGLDKAWYVALNFNTKSFVIIEVERDEELIDFMKESVQEQLVVEKFSTDFVYQIQGEIPEVALGAPIDRSDSNVNSEGWN